MSLTLAFMTLLLGVEFPSLQDIGTIAPYYELSQEDYSVYSAVINGIYVSEKTKRIVILNETKERQILKPQFHLNVPCVLITREEANELCIQCADTPFYERYPDSPGYIKLSGISFNSRLSRASVLIERYCGILCAEGIYVTLIKQDGIWVVQSKNVSWES